METCAKCGQSVICAHSLDMDGFRGHWRLCCLCAAELIASLSKQPQEDPQ